MAWGSVAAIGAVTLLNFLSPEITRQVPSGILLGGITALAIFGLESTHAWWMTDMKQSILQNQNIQGSP